MEAGSKENSRRRQRKTNGAKGETDFFAEMIRNRSCNRAARNTAYEGTAGSPSHPCCIEMKQLAQVANGAADHNIVVPEQQAAESGNAGCDDERNVRALLKRGQSQIIGLAVRDLRAEHVLYPKIPTWP